MNKQKRILIILLAVQVGLIILHVILRKTSTNIDNWVTEAGWHYWLSLLFGIYLIVYAFSISCKKCGARQVFRSISIFDIRWPQDNCWKCNQKR